MRRLLLAVLVFAAIPSAAQLTVQADGNVVIGAAGAPSNLNVSGVISGSGAVPVGAVIDWWRPNANFPVPPGYQICDGGKVTDPASPYFDQTLPNLNERFIRGVTSLAAIGSTGGSASNTPGAGSGFSGRHVHTLPTATGNPFNGGDNPGPVPYFARDDHQGWSSNVHIRVDDGISTSEGQHRHALGGDTGLAGDHQHIITIGTVPTVPPYYGLLKIMRIR